VWEALGDGQPTWGLRGVYGVSARAEDLPGAPRSHHRAAAPPQPAGGGVPLAVEPLAHRAPAGVGAAARAGRL
jgi:hypothetical protein